MIFVFEYHIYIICTRINNTDKVLITADKSRNIYQINKSDYNKFLRENVTKTYERFTANQMKKINRHSKMLKIC